MTMSINKPLEAVLEELLEEGSPTAANLQRWLQTYPQYHKEIKEFVSEWQLQARLPEEKAVVDAKAIGAQVVAGVHAELVKRSTQPFHGILNQAQRLGIRLEKEAAELGVNVTLFDMLEKKRVRAN